MKIKSSRLLPMFSILAVLIISIRALSVSPAYAADENYSTIQTANKVSAEDWKGAERPYNLTASAILLGGGLIDSALGWPVALGLSYRFMPEGWLEDINDSVSMEFVGGTLMVKGSDPFIYSLHFRWDFIKDSAWTFFALGGLGGAKTGDGYGNNFRIHPRLGVGTFFFVRENIAARAEISHELFALGASFFF